MPYKPWTSWGEMIYRTWAGIEHVLGYTKSDEFIDTASYKRAVSYKRAWHQDLDMFRAVFDEGDIGLFCSGTPSVPSAWALFNGEELLQSSSLARHLLYYALYVETKMPDALRSKCQTFLTIYLKEFYLWRIQRSASAEPGWG